MTEYTFQKGRDKLQQKFETDGSQIENVKMFNKSKNLREKKSSRNGPVIFGSDFSVSSRWFLGDNFAMISHETIYIHKMAFLHNFSHGTEKALTSIGSKVKKTGEILLAVKGIIDTSKAIYSTLGPVAAAAAAAV